MPLLVEKTMERACLEEESNQKLSVGHKVPDAIYLFT